MIDFSYKSYLELLEYIRHLAYRIGPFRDFPESGPYVILRHDIDFSVPKAEEMATLEYQKGIKSTFFVLLTSPYYSALWEDNVQSMRRIVAMGHEVGLHYDCTGFDRLTPKDQYRRISTFIACLEDHLSIKITAISQHKPTESGMNPGIPGYVDAYSRAFFKDIAYVSDSRMMFGVQNLYAFFRDNPRSQMLIHPIWWHSRPKTREEVFEYIKQQLLTQGRDRIDSEHRAIVEFFKAQDTAQRI